MTGKATLIAAAVVALAAMTAFAQTAPPQGREGGEFREGRGRERVPGQPGRFDPEQMRERMRETWKQRLQASDEEWAVIEPLITKVTEARRQTRPGPGRGGPGGQRPPEGTEGSDLRKATDALRQALEDNNTPPETLKARLDELRAARAAAEAELKKAQDELRAVLTVRQEAQLVLMGLLD